MGTESGRNNRRHRIIHQSSQVTLKMASIADQSAIHTKVCTNMTRSTVMVSSSGSLATATRVTTSRMNETAME